MKNFRLEEHNNNKNLKNTQNPHKLLSFYWSSTNNQISSRHSAARRLSRKFALNHHSQLEKVKKSAPKCCTSTYWTNPPRKSTQKLKFSAIVLSNCTAGSGWLKYRVVRSLTNEWILRAKRVDVWEITTARVVIVIVWSAVHTHTHRPYLCSAIQIASNNNSAQRAAKSTENHWQRGWIARRNPVPEHVFAGQLCLYRLKQLYV